ncbi:M23 family metallopeptidase [Pelagibius litoralis]|uniref:M23 family metallopeptidase n=1 Tax=Pelagibius litoralis TaxID=374515 RepID=A0A967K872_9PROT|nr:M23 family metallopeptidase [Pelagibius litoralis]NIA70273.1 M23 family metallopeptidase [Pelagibius litoralis]
MRRAIPNLLFGTVLGAWAAFATGTAQAQPLSPPGGGFDLPVDCVMGAVCNIQNYIDHDPGEGWKDHACGPLSYDGHRGVDFRVPTQIEMRAGVAVIAAAGGKVLFAYDGQPDILMQDSGPGKTREERNGNWVAIGHGDGWVTTYAHLRKGTVAVKKGDIVKRGDKLGLIGLSGNSDFPHVHFAVTHRNKLLDPFIGLEPAANCGETSQNLWSEAAQAQIPYRAGGLLSAGFLDRQADHREVMEGVEAPGEISAKAPVLVFWVGAWGIRKGDMESTVILGPDGRKFVGAERIVERNRATLSRFVGKRLRNESWPKGTYRGIYRVERKVGDTTYPVIDVVREVVVH